MDNSKGSFLPSLLRIKGLLREFASLTFPLYPIALLLFTASADAAIPKHNSSHTYFDVNQDTVGAIYDDIDRRPARFRGTRQLFLDGPRERDIDSPAVEPEYTREELMERLSAPTDSTARLKHFKFRRHDVPYARLTAKKRHHPLFLRYNESIYRTSAELDSLGASVIIREKIGDYDVKIPVRLSMEYYIKERSRAVIRGGWQELAHAYDEIETGPVKTDLSDFISDITTIDIPVPPNPLLNIFGKPGLRLNISGAVDIRAAVRRQKSDQTILTTMDQTRNEPDFRQDVQITVDGLIGDKLNINADWNTQRTFEYENMLKIRYQGYEDEIVRSVEAGNVSLRTPTRYIGSSQALFGIKTELQFGPLYVTALASQQKGRSEEISLTGGTQEQTFEIRPYDYSRNHFFVDAAYIDLYEDAMAIDPSWDPRLEITDIEVWVTRTGIITDVNERSVAAHINLPTLQAEGGWYGPEWRDISTGVSGEIELGQFVMLREGEGYLINPRTGRLTLLTQLANEQAVAVAYRRADNSVYGDFISSVDDDSTRIVLKLVRPRNLIPVYRDAWKLQLRNIYSIGGRNLQEAGFELRIEYDIPGSQPLDQLDGQLLLNVMGLDLTDETGSPIPDNRFDWRPGITIDVGRGELIFPSLRPFDDKLNAAGLGEYSFPEVYDTTSREAANVTSKDRFRIRGRYVSSVTSTYNLGFNVVQGSVVVFMGGQRLQEGTDYTVDYMLGQITIRNEAALQPNSNLRITYEQNELFQIASKNLVGLRAELPFGNHSDLNFTMMSMSENTLADRVRVGEEPISNVIMGIDGRTRIPMNFITDGMNRLPLFESIQESALQISGEVAHIRPNRNTKRSTVEMDQGRGVAYIDDFEGARRSVPIGVTPGNWKYASPPVETPELGTLPPDSIVQHKAKAYWYNALQQEEVTVVRDIWREREVQQGEENVIVLQIKYDPRARGEYNYSWNLLETIHNTPRNSWGGMMRSMTGSTNNLIDENLNFIEFWARIDGDVKDGRMFINMGQITERVIYEERLRGNRVAGIHQEDGSRGRGPTGVLNTGEDVGLDGIPTEEEREVFADWIAHYAGTVYYESLMEDPSGDNYSPPRIGQYSGVTGVEGNESVSQSIPDTEDLNRNGIVDLVNSYFEYEISLDTTNAISDNPHITGGGHNGWYQFRIPIRSFDRTVGNPSFDNVEFFRIWFSGFEEPIHLRIAEFAFTGNQWEEEQRGDTTLVISVLNKHENPTVYDSPPGVRPPRIRLSDGSTIDGNEQSLLLMINDLPPDDSRQAFRYFPRRSLDVFNYRTMRMFIHGDPSWHADDTGENYDAEIFIRFGSDTSNYYEYRQPVWPFWDERNALEIDFGELTATKAIRDSATNISPRVPVTGGPPGSTYRTVRNPSLTDIRYISIGIRNPSGVNRTGRPLKGEVWINEMRLLDVDNTPGWAYNVSSTLNFADFATVRFNFAETDPNFHRIDQQFGSRQSRRNWDFSANLRLHKFLPRGWQQNSDIPLNYTRTEEIVNPVYIPNTDILITGAMERQREQLEESGVSPEEAQRIVEQMRVETQTVRVSDSYSAPAIRFRVPTNRWYVRETVNNLSFGFNYNVTRDRSPSIQFRDSWSWQGRADYNLSFSRNNYKQPFSGLLDGIPLLDHYKDIRFFYTPTNFSTGMDLSRTRTNERLRGQNEDRPTVRNFRANRHLSFAWRFTDNAFINPTLDYRLNIASSLLHLETDEKGAQRPFSEIIDELVGGPRLLNFGIDNDYRQNVRIDTRPRLPSLWGINQYLEVTSGYNVGYRWARNLAQETLGRSSGVNARLDATLNLNLKSLGDRIFGESGGPPPRGRSPQRPQRSQSLQGRQDSGSNNNTDTSVSGLAIIGKALRYLIKVPFLDFERVTLNFNQTRNIQNSGLVGGTGLSNFWGKIPFYDEPDFMEGPSRRYQLGLSSSPGYLRAPNGNLVDNFSETNNITLRTQRQLWRGARLNLSWSYSWSFNRNHSLQTDDFGVPEIVSTTLTGEYNKSFLTLPSFPGFKIFGGNMDEVMKLFQAALDDPQDTRPEGEKLSDSFEKGMESFSLLRGILGEMLPRVNWTFRWEGLERLGIFQNWATRVSLDHAYESSYAHRWRGRPDSDGKQTEMQRITMRFNPLIGLNVTFRELFKGNVSARARYNTATNYDLNYSSRIIVENLTHEISFTASYGRRGFEMPLFGISLRNDMDISMTYSMSRTERIRYSTESLRGDGEGLTDDGATRTSFEPRIRYVISQRVTASIFYRFSKISPNKEGSRTTGMTTNEAGLDISIFIR